MRSNVKFIAYLNLNHAEVVVDGFALNDQGEFDIAIVRTKLSDPRQDDPPLLFHRLTVQIFFEWLLTLRKRDVSRPKITAYNSHRAALFNLFRDYRVVMSDELVAELRNHFKGLKRTLASEAADGRGEVTSGKSPLRFSLYKQLAAFGLRSLKSGHTFAHLFLIMCWNLMCRAGNAVSICFSHLEWREDALGIYFAHMKNDQLGERPKDPRHVYANPVNPEICPILALGIYLMSFPSVLEGSNLFPGGEQYDRFRRTLSEIVRCIGAADDIGSHSARKGASTYVSSGIPLRQVHKQSISVVAGLWVVFMTPTSDSKLQEINTSEELCADCHSNRLYYLLFLMTIGMSFLELKLRLVSRIRLRCVIF